MRILQWLLQTDSGVVGLILRITLTVVMFPHRAPDARCRLRYRVRDARSYRHSSPAIRLLHELVR